MVLMASLIKFICQGYPSQSFLAVRCQEDTKMEENCFYQPKGFLSRQNKTAETKL